MGGIGENALELYGAVMGRVLVEGALPRATSDAPQLRVAERQRGERIIGARCEQDLTSRREEVAQSLPFVAQHRSAAGRGFEQTSRGTVAQRRERGARDVEGERGRAEEC